MLLHRSVLKREKPVTCTAVRDEIKLYWHCIERKKTNTESALFYNMVLYYIFSWKKKKKTLALPLDMISNHDKHEKRIERHPTCIAVGAGETRTAIATSRNLWFEHLLTFLTIMENLVWSIFHIYCSVQVSSLYSPHI